MRKNLRACVGTPAQECEGVRTVRRNCCALAPALESVCWSWSRDSLGMHRTAGGHTMQSDRDTERIELTRRQMLECGLDALVCALPSDVLMLSGYWPIAGNTLAVATSDSVTLLSPEGAVPFAERGWADSVIGYELGSLKHLRSLTEVIQPRLGDLLQKLKLGNSRIGFASGPWVQPAPYAAMTSFGGSMAEMLRAIAPRADRACGRPAGGIAADQYRAGNPQHSKRMHRGGAGIRSCARSHSSWRQRNAGGGAGARATDATSETRRSLRWVCILHVGPKRGRGV